MALATPVAKLLSAGTASGMALATPVAKPLTEVRPPSRGCVSVVMSIGEACLVPSTRGMMI